MNSPDGTDYLNENRFVAINFCVSIVIEHVTQPHFILTIDFTRVEGGTQLSWVQVFDDVHTTQVVKQRAGSANEENIDRLNRVLSQNFEVVLR